MESMTLTIAQKFEVERWNRIIDDTKDVGELRKAAKLLLQAWQSQKAATLWAMRDALSAPPRYDHLTPSQEYLDQLHKEVSQRQHDPDQPQGEEDPAG